MDKITLSPSKLNLLKECPRCFYDANVSDVARPRGIFPSLPGGMDIVMKKFFDHHRGDLPAFLKGHVPGVLFQDMEKMKRWRYWKTAPRYIDTELNLEVYMAIDDLLIDENGAVSPLDVKTKGSEPKDDGSQYYQLQMDLYNLGFANSGFPVKDQAHLIYIYPSTEFVPWLDADKNALGIPFCFKVFRLECSQERAKDTLRRACEILRGPRPAAGDSCESCIWAQTVNALGKEQ